MLRWHIPVVGAMSALLCAGALRAQQVSPKSDPHAIEVLRAALDREFADDATDRSRWMYLDHNKQPGSDSYSRVVDVPGDSLRRCIRMNGRVIAGEEEQHESERIARYIQGTAIQEKTRRNGLHDDAAAAQIMRNLPFAFVWSVKAENDKFVRLTYAPNPAFSPATMEQKVMSAMTGDLVVERAGHHIYSLSGHLVNDVRMGFGLVKLKQGGNFDVERRDIGNGHWQIVEQHTHIDGHAFLFKTISQQEDDWKSEFVPSPAQSMEDGGRLLHAIP